MGKSVIIIINTYFLSITFSLLQIFVKFQPRDAGEYEQSWDLMVSDKNELVLLLMGFKVGGTRRRIEGAKKTSENKLFLSKSKVARQCLFCFLYQYLPPTLG